MPGVLGNIIALLLVPLSVTGHPKRNSSPTSKNAPSNSFLDTNTVIRQSPLACVHSRTNSKYRQNWDAIASSVALLEIQANAGFSIATAIAIVVDNSS